MAEDTRLSLQELFDPDYYRTKNPDLAGLSNSEALFHFQIYGLLEERLFSPFVDLEVYRTSNPDVAGLGNQQLVQQFLDLGLAQGRRFSSVVDLNLYKTSNPDLRGLDNNQLLRHLIEYGVEEGRRFSNLVDLKTYRQSNPDLANFSNKQLLDHYLTVGGQEARPSLPFFDVNFYRQSNEDLATFTNSDLVNHFLGSGLKEGRRFSPYVDIRYYVENNPDLKLAFGGNNNSSNIDYQKAFEHFQTRGLEEGRRISPFLDVNYYLANNVDLRAAGFNPRQAFDHFVNNGINEGRRPSLIFDPVYYLANNADLAGAGFTYKQALEHFESSGVNERRSASSFFDPISIEPLINVDIPTQIANPSNLQGGTKWNVPANGRLTYSFVTAATAGSYEGRESGVRELTPQIKNYIRNILQAYQSVLPFQLVEVADRPSSFGQLRFMFSNGPRDQSLDGTVFAYAYVPADPDSQFPNPNGQGTTRLGTRGGDVHLNPDRSIIDFSAGPGSFAYEVILHEIAHALGLQHPFDDGQDEPTLPTGKDSNSNTVMGYSSSFGRYTGSYAVTPMAYDIRALQLLYGANYLNSGDTAYRFDTNNFIGANEFNGQNGIKQTIWDSGGIDTFDFSGLPPTAFGYYFDMNEGGYNTTQLGLNGATYEVFAAPGSVFTTNSFGTTIGFGFQLENLIGSQGDDEILGNNISNNISGAAGNDIITGAGGGDRLSGGDGSDIFVLAPGEGGSNPALADIITDFTKGQDLIGLSIGLSFDRLRITPGNNPNDTLIQDASTGEFLAVLSNMPSFAINNADFTFV